VDSHVCALKVSLAKDATKNCHAPQIHAKTVVTALLMVSVTDAIAQQELLASTARKETHA